MSSSLVLKGAVLFGETPDDCLRVVDWERKEEIESPLRVVGPVLDGPSERLFRVLSKLRFVGLCLCSADFDGKEDCLAVTGLEGDGGGQLGPELGV